MGQTEMVKPEDGQNRDQRKKKRQTIIYYAEHYTEN